MEIAETTFFTREITRILSDDEYKELQSFLVEHPKSGAVIKGSGGLRKIRWSVKNSGKSGGIRNIYYYHEENSLILMIYVYEKSKTSDLSPKQIEMLRKTFIGGLLRWKIQCLMIYLQVLVKQKRYYSTHENRHVHS